MGSADKAEKIFEEMEADESSNSRYYYEYIKFLFSIHKTSQAKNVYNKAIKKFPNNKYILTFESRFDE